MPNAMIEPRKPLRRRMVEYLLLNPCGSVGNPAVNGWPFPTTSWPGSHIMPVAGSMFGVGLGKSSPLAAEKKVLIRPSVKNVQPSLSNRIRSADAGLAASSSAPQRRPHTTPRRRTELAVVTAVTSSDGSWGPAQAAGEHRDSKRQSDWRSPVLRFYYALAIAGRQGRYPKA